MPQFDPKFVAAYLADNLSSDSKNMTEFEKADSLEQRTEKNVLEQRTEKNVANIQGFDQRADKNMASFDAAAEEWDAVAEVEATFGAGRKEKVAVVAVPILTMRESSSTCRRPGLKIIWRRCVQYDLTRVQRQDF